MTKWAPFKACFVLGICISSLAACQAQEDAAVVAAETVAAPTLSPYRELLDTEIRGIDDETIEGYLTGKGLGLALPAELNGYPGPRHVLDMAAELELTAEQQVQIQTLFDDMQGEAIALGEQILAAEAQLESDFRAGAIDEASLQAQLTAVGELRTQLRFVHLRTHLATIDILTPHQVQMYNVVRGYEDAPADHNQHQHDG